MIFTPHTTLNCVICCYNTLQICRVHLLFILQLMASYWPVPWPTHPPKCSGCLLLAKEWHSLVSHVTCSHLDCCTVQAWWLQGCQLLWHMAFNWLVLQGVWLADLDKEWETHRLLRILGNLQCIMGLCDQCEFPKFPKGHLQSPSASLMAGKWPAIRAGQGTVK